MKKTLIFMICIMLFMFGTISCEQSGTVSKNINEGKKIELYLPKLSDTYHSVIEHWDELELDKVTLMDKPLLDSSDIENMDNQTIKVKKNFIIINGTGSEDALIFDDKKDEFLKFKYKGKEYKFNSKSPELFYNYTIYDICVVIKNDNIFLVKQRDFRRKEDSTGNAVHKREYSEGIIGIPYVLVIDGKRTELGVLKVADAEFAVPDVKDSWCYMGMPGGMVERLPKGKTLKMVKGLPEVKTLKMGKTEAKIFKIEN